MATGKTEMTAKLVTLWVPMAEAILCAVEMVRAAMMLTETQMLMAVAKQIVTNDTKATATFAVTGPSDRKQSSSEMALLDMLKVALKALRTVNAT